MFRKKKTKKQQHQIIAFIKSTLFVIFQQGNIILVDTPGIGGSGNVQDKLIEYLPNALLFIFVINAGSAGGMQSDRVNTYNVYCI